MPAKPRAWPELELDGLGKEYGKTLMTKAGEDENSSAVGAIFIPKIFWKEDAKEQERLDYGRQADPVAIL